MDNMTTEILADPPQAANLRPTGIVQQKFDFRSGNEAAALAARNIGFHVMGYFPITPSTEVAENLSEMQADGEHDIVMITAAATVILAAGAGKRAAQAIHDALAPRQ
jgi:TPP-dependent indolepyruvate ferredoxin oxidoreductase alpha subunit